MRIRNFLGFCLPAIAAFFSSFAKGDTECPNVISFEDRRKDKNSLRLMQYNVEWFFIDYYSNANCPGSGCPWKTTSDAKTHMTYISDVIKQLNPDMVNFCEIEGCDEFSNLVTQLNDNSYKYYLKKGTDTATGQNVGLLTRIDPLINLYRTETKVSYPLPNSKCGYTGSSSSGVSKHYITEFSLSGIKTALISAHLIAIPTDPSRCAQREAQAQILQYVASDYVSKGYEVILLGDMNDFDSEVKDMNNDSPTSRVLDILKGLDGEKKGTYSLTNVAQKVPQNERYSDWYDSDNNCDTSSIKDYSMIDHVLVTSKIYNKISNVFMYHGYSEYCGKWNSDHYPVVIDFVL
jgi:exonuclease III